MTETTRARLERAAALVFRRIPLVLAAALLLVGVAINIANVIGRYLLLTAIYWAEEAMIYLAIWSIFLAAIAIAYDRADLNMDLLSARLPARWRRRCDGVIAAVCIATFGFMVWQCIAIMRLLVRNGQKSLALEIPMAVPQSALLIGFAALALATAVRWLLGTGPTRAEAPHHSA
jgi:TRAP-type C4-dicarboxylate transport system permease small subunit